MYIRTYNIYTWKPFKINTLPSNRVQYPMLHTQNNHQCEFHCLLSTHSLYNSTTMINIRVQIFHGKIMLCRLLRENENTTFSSSPHSQLHFTECSARSKVHKYPIQPRHTTPNTRAHNSIGVYLDARVPVRMENAQSHDDWFEISIIHHITLLSQQIF